MISFSPMKKAHRRNSAIIASLFLIVFLLLPLPNHGSDSAQKRAYYPGKADDWEKRGAQDLGMDPEKLAEAVEFARTHGWEAPKDLTISIQSSFAREPHGTIIGPVKERGDTNGIVLKGGYIIAEWGDTRRVDMTFSVTKSYLSTTTGLALDAGLIRGVQDPVQPYVPDGTFESEHNAKITWHHLLNQTSDWSGTLWEKPDWADRPPRDVKWDELRNRPLKEPGTSYKYNDVRVNLLAYSLLQIWRTPLPIVLKNRIMDPIDASPTWRWHGYSNSWVLLDGLHMQSVSGGGHWGGGMFICTRDQARLGLLFLRRGSWKGQQLISEEWIDALKVPSAANPIYGYMWWLNTGRKSIPSAPESVFYAAGFGGNYIYVDNENDLVIAVRWVGNTRNLDGIVQRVLASMEKAGQAEALR